jgi:hypothetical protein
MSDSNFTWEQTDLRCAIRGRGVQITFERSGDRWTHHLAFDCGPARKGTPGIAAAALETDAEHADAARIVSPVYQEITRHDFAGDRMRGLCLLLTGRLFTHHFSAAVSVLTEHGDPDAVVIDFDIADRCRAHVASLAATYQIQLGSSNLSDAGPQAIVWCPLEDDAGAGRGRIELHSDPPGSLALTEAGRQATRIQAVAAIDPAVFTHRLRYRWRWASCSGLTR